MLVSFVRGKKITLRVSGSHSLPVVTDSSHKVRAIVRVVGTTVFSYDSINIRT